MRTHVLLDTLSFLPPLLETYAPQDYPRIERRLLELLEHGLAPPGASPLVLPGLDEAADPPTYGDEGTERFMGAATRLINERGYHGTSVELIASRLNVTKGSFYHHLEAKDDLVLQCFERSLSTLDAVLDAAANLPGSRFDRLGSVLSTLLGIQLSQRTPLLRSIALSALPNDLRGSVVARSDRITRRVSGIIVDCISEGSLPPVDPLVAGHMLMSGVNAAFELRDRAARLPLARAIALYGAILLNGILMEERPGPNLETSRDSPVKT
jgi:AcrR family transcriptional regulator